MILLAGLPEEPPMALVRDALEDIGAPYRLFDQRTHAHTDMHCRVGMGGRLGGELTLSDGDPVDLERVTAIYHRLHGAQSFSDLAKATPDCARLIRFNRLVNGFSAFCDGFDGRAMNRTPGMVTNNSKPLQAQIIARYGFDVPATCITNNRARAIDFIEANAARGRETIFKSASSVRSVVRTVTAREIETGPDIRACPVQFQERVAGVDYRVHVVGTAVHASRIVTNGVDYRYAKRDPDGDTEIFATEVPDAVARNAVALARGLDLLLAGIDLRRTPDGDWYCFEVNPSPAFSYYEAHTGQPIAASIAQALVSDVEQ